MRSVRFVAVLLSLLVCSLGSWQRSDGQSTDLPDTAPLASIGAGSNVVVNADIVLPANQGTIYFQSGVLLPNFQAIDKSAPSCRLSAVDSPVVRKLVPGRKLVVTATRGSTGVQNLYGDVLEFELDTAISEIQCTSGHKGQMSIGELKTVFGGLFSLVQAPPVVG
jgi:hypothetical protein